MSDQTNIGWKEVPDDNLIVVVRRAVRRQEQIRDLLSFERQKMCDSSIGRAKLFMSSKGLTSIQFQFRHHKYSTKLAGRAEIFADGRILVDDKPRYRYEWPAWVVCQWLSEDHESTGGADKALDPPTMNEV